MGKKSFAYPKIRIDLEPFKYQDQNGNFYISLKDPLELSRNRILIPQDLFFVIQFFDGSHSIADLEEKYRQQFSSPLQSIRLLNLLKKLDQAMLLDNSKSKTKSDQLRRKFAALKTRSPLLAGNSYPENRDEIIEFMQHCEHQAMRNKSASISYDGKSVKAIVVPHIDPRLGGHVYASVYRSLAASVQAEVYVILGISHQPTTFPYALTRKDFKTPLGLVKTEQDFISELCSNQEVDYFTDELVHRDEHSIEFQTLYLQHYLAADVSIVPILTSFSHIRSKDENDRLHRFICDLKRTAEAYTKSICFIASVDFAHLGLLYGDETEPDPYLLSAVELFDRNVLKAVAQRDVVGFENIFKNSGNKYHICGYPALRTLLGVLPSVQSQLLAYDNAIMDDHRSTVTFAGMTFI